MWRRITLLKHFDWILFAAIILLAVFGLLAMYSIAFSVEQPDFFLLKRQAIFVVVGIGLTFLVGLSDYRWLHAASRWLYIAGAGLLVAVLLVGVTVRGTTGWLDIGGFRFQPVELVKIFLLVFLAAYFSKWARQLREFKHLLISGVGAALFTVLVLLQPDFGSAVILFAIWLGLILAIGIKRSHLLLLVGSLAILFTVSWLFLFQDYQKARLTSFFDPGSDPLGRGYNLTQSTIAVGAGQLFGRGLGDGSQSQLRFLPEAQTDFVFAVIAEEFGFIGVSLLLGFWAIVLWRLYKAMIVVRDDFALFFIIGVTVTFFVHLFINAGMNMSIMPVTGITLPFVSYGGSSLLTNFLLLGIIQSAIIRAQAR